MRFVQKISLVVALAAGGLLSGCCTILSHVDGQGGVYSGVSADARLLATVSDETHDIPVVPWVIPFGILDMPLSAAADTLCLPVVLATTKSHTNSTSGKAK
jgi:uncharacterized protein YceK